MLSARLYDSDEVVTMLSDWHFPPLTASILPLIDGELSTGQLLDVLEAAQISDKTPRTRAEIKAQVGILFRSLRSMNGLALTHEPWPASLEQAMIALLPQSGGPACSVEQWFTL